MAFARPRRAEPGAGPGRVEVAGQVRRPSAMYRATGAVASRAVDVTVSCRRPMAMGEEGPSVRDHVAVGAGSSAGFAVLAGSLGHARPPAHVGGLIRQVEDRIQSSASSAVEGHVLRADAARRSDPPNQTERRSTPRKNQRPPQKGGEDKKEKKRYQKPGLSRGCFTGECKGTFNTPKALWLLSPAGPLAPRQVSSLPLSARLSRRVRPSCRSR